MKKIKRKIYADDGSGLREVSPGEIRGMELERICVDEAIYFSPANMSKLFNKPFIPKESECST